MKLLLDEHYSSAVARELRNRGYDAVAVVARSDLRGLQDEDLLRWAQGEGRVLVTENVGDFMVLHRAFLARAEVHGGLLFTSSHAFPRRTSAIGGLVTALAAFLDERGPDAALEGDVAWL